MCFGHVLSVVWGDWRSDRRGVGRNDRLKLVR